MAVRSRRLFGPLAIETSGADVLLYTVPEGRTAVVRSLSAVVTAGTSVTVVWVCVVPGQPARELHAVSGVASGQTIVVPYTVVLNPLDVLRGLVFGTTPATRWYGGGSLLLGAPQ